MVIHMIIEGAKWTLCKRVVKKEPMTADHLYYKIVDKIGTDRSLYIDC